MVNECCIKGCWHKTLTYNGNKDNSKSLFRAPQNGTSERRRWEEKVWDHVKENFRRKKNLYVCEDHYEDTCFFRNEISLMTDGRCEAFSRKRRRLITDSLPTKFLLDLDQNNATHPNASLPSISIAMTHNSYSSNKNGLQSFPSPKKQLLVSLSNLATSSIKDEPSSDEQITESPENTLYETDFTSNRATSVNIHEMDKDIVYNVNKLIADWNNCQLMFTQPWEYITLPGIGVQFVCYSHSETSPLRGIIVRNSMTIQAMARGKVVSYQTKISHVTRIDDLLSAVREVSALQVCEGSFDQFCPVGLYVRKATRKCDRCLDCQKKYRRKYETTRQREVKTIKKKRKKQTQKLLNNSLQRSWYQVSHKSQGQDCHTSEATNTKH